MASAPAAIGQCDSNNTCPDPTYCCSFRKYCGQTESYCGVWCLGGHCSGSGSGGLGAGAYAGIAVAVVAVAILVAWLLFRHIRRRKGRSKPDHESAVQTINTSLPNRVVKYSEEDLRVATSNFTKKLGQGGFGVVFLGILEDDTKIAVKELLEGESKDFEAEVITLGSINHGNLVALLGFCKVKTPRKSFLVYEFVARGSLDKLIFQKDKVDETFVLPWKTRVDIVKGTAKGLAYLHEDLQKGQAIIHLDIKPENILLTTDYFPKIADFGLAKLLGAKRTQTVSMAAGGTVGYMAPEIASAPASAKMDVYSFGIVLLEVISGRRHTDPSQDLDEGVYLPAWAMRKLTGGQEMHVIDPLLHENECDAEEVKRLVLVALLCLQYDPDERPRMSDLMRMIGGDLKPPVVSSTLKSDLERTEKLVHRTVFNQSETINQTLDSPFNMNFPTEEVDTERDTREYPRPLLRGKYSDSRNTSVFTRSLSSHE